MTIPYRLANGVGNPPDANKFMADYDWLTAVMVGNFTLNGGFETWDVATSFTNPANGTAIASPWLLRKTGSAAPVADVSREATIKDTGTYAAKFDITSAGSSDSILALDAVITSGVFIPGQTLVTVWRIRTGQGSKVRLKISDGTTTEYSEYHTGSGLYETLQAVMTAGVGATAVTISVEITSDFIGTVYADGATLWDIPAGMQKEGRASLLYSTIHNRDSIVTPTELDYLSGVTSSIQTQLNAKQATGNYITALTGEVTAAGPGSVAATVSNAAVIAKVLTGYVSGAGTVAATDTILQAIQKLNGNIAGFSSSHNSLSGLQGGTTSEYYHLTSAEHTIATQAATNSLAGYLSAADHTSFAGGVTTANAALPTASFTAAAVTGKLITGFVSGAGTVAATDTILQAINKLDGNMAGGGFSHLAGTEHFTGFKYFDVGLYATNTISQIQSDGTSVSTWLENTGAGTMDLTVKAASGIPALHFIIGSSAYASIGLDPSGTLFKISMSQLLVTTPFLTVSSSCVGIFYSNSLGLTGLSAAPTYFTINTTTQDAAVRFSDGVAGWMTGIDTSDSSAFKISYATTFGTGDYLRISVAGVATFTGAQLISTGSGATKYLSNIVTSNNEINSLIQRNEAAGSYNQAWYFSMSASSKNLTLNDGSTNKLIVDAATGAITIGSTVNIGGILTRDTGSVDDTTFSILQTLGGNGTERVAMKTFTTTGITTAKKIFDLAQYGNLLIVNVCDASNNQATDLIWASYAGTATVISAYTGAGTPAARTYSIATGDLRVAMASGTYTANVICFEMRAR